MLLLDSVVSVKITDWLAISISIFALIVSIVSIVLQYKKQSWLKVEILSYSYTPNAYTRFRLQLTNTKSRKHSITRISLKSPNFNEDAGETMAHNTSFGSLYFQEGETKSVIIYFSDFATTDEKKFKIKFLTDSCTKTLTKRQLLKYLKANHLHSALLNRSEKTNS